MKTGLNRLLRDKRGQGMVEYGILVGGIALIALAAVAILGHKTNDLLSTVAASLPGAHSDDIGPIQSGKLVNTTNTDGSIKLDATAPGSIAGNVGIPGISGLVVEPN
ncbi:MAG: Flp family type IVb pilin [Planctomycetota bacterium]